MQTVGAPTGDSAGGAPRKLTTMMSCDYNGWNDAPEDEREWFDEHPEIWGDPAPDHRIRPIRALRRPSPSRFRGGLAA